VFVIAASISIPFGCFAKAFCTSIY
jgi:hypothetical protein